MQQYKAHINDRTREIQTVREHSENTARLCKEFAIPILKDILYNMGILHDIGKYLSEFQDRLDGKNIQVEHSICGAITAGELYPKGIGLLLEYCIAGHHSGIPDGGFPNDTADLQTLSGRLKRQVKDYEAYKQELVLSAIKTEEVLEFLLQDCKNNIELFIDKFSFVTRYCFSCLTDADSIDTADFCNGRRIRPLTADFTACLKRVNTKLSSFICKTPLQKTRASLQAQVFQKIEIDAEIYLMNMPTGSGKTLCSIKYALERAIRKGKKRIIYVIPYNSIIDQTISVFEKLFEEDAEILRHQSTFSYEEEDYAEDYRNAARRATENWDATSIIVTTAVQFFESVYANKRGKLRKLHNMADSVLIFDEAHLMPQDYLQPCLRSIAYITKYLNSEAVFLTATMPDFSKLIKQYAFHNSKIVDLVEDTAHFTAFQKCNYEYLEKQSPREILMKSSQYPSCLIIVNKKQAARKIFQECSGRRFHLSTYMTAADRKKTIDEIKRALKELEEDYPDYRNVPENRRIIIVSTSLIEAGVDLDVYTVFRELSGLDSILQAGGRCNREGKRENARVYIFELENEKTNAQDIKCNITKGILERYPDISCPQSITEYYDRLFFVNRDAFQKHTISNGCCDISSIPFKQYAASFELIESKTISMVVPRDESSKKTVEALKYTGGGIGIGRKLQKYTCSVYQYELDDLIRQHVAEDYGTGIWCLTNPDYYNAEIGILFEARDYYL